MVADPYTGPQGETAKLCLGGTPKRLFDIAIGSALLASTLPLLLASAAALKCAGAVPVFKREPRLGYGGRSFLMIELVTTARESPLSEPATTTPSQAVRRRNRIACIGFFLRESGIYKLPQLVNVIRGEMSLVGPRALDPSEAEYLGDRIAAYLTARPGLVQMYTGPNRRKGCDIEGFAAGLDYIRDWCFSMDIVALVHAIFASREL